MSPLRRQFVYTLLLLPLAFGLWYAAGSLFAAPASWLAGVALTAWLPDWVDTASLDGTVLAVTTQWGQLDGSVVAAARAGNQLVFEVNTRLVSYGIAFYTALTLASADEGSLLRFCVGLLLQWLIMALGLLAMLGKDLMLNVGGEFLTLPGVPPAPVIALTYQFSVLLAPTLVPVLIWALQLRGTPLWDALAAGAKAAASPR